MKLRVTRIGEQLVRNQEGVYVLGDLLCVRFEGEASFDANMTPTAVRVHGLAVSDWYSISFVPCDPPAKENA